MAVEIHGARPAKILLDGEEIAFAYDGCKAVFTAKTAGRGDKQLVYHILY